MTALVGVFGAGAATAGASLAAMFAKMRNRGDAVPEQFVGPGAFIASRRHEWEVDQNGWSGPVLTVKEDWIVAADASLYYLTDLRRRVARIADVDRTTTPGELIVAALRAWGDRFARYLEGDYAIIAWHRPSGRVLAARDYAGSRSLTFSITWDRTLVLASSPLAVVEFPGVSRGFDLDFIAASVAGLAGPGGRTAFEKVSVVPGGSTLSFESATQMLVNRVHPPPFSSDWEDETSDRAADELRALIEGAVSERLPTAGQATVWMSGGWDSTSIFASGRAAIGRFGTSGVRLQPVTLRYPEGDTGDESVFVDLVARRWDAKVHWVSVGELPLFEDAQRRASVRDDPRVHPFESQIRGLARASRRLDSRTAMDGVGGDHLFMVSSAAVLADHLRSGRWNQLWRAWSSWGRRMPDVFARACLLPQLTVEGAEWIGSVRGRPLRGHGYADLPPWVRRTPSLIALTIPQPQRDPHEGVSEWETRQALTNPLVARTLAWNHAITQEEGVLLRSPFLDRRVVDFAATRPLNDRHGGSNSKVLLRRAMRDLLPAPVLEPRERKTGTPADYFMERMRSEAPAEFRRIFGTGNPLLAQMGLVDLPALRSAMDAYLASGHHMLGAFIQLAIECERWLATHDRRE